MPQQDEGDEGNDVSVRILWILGPAPRQADQRRPIRPKPGQGQRSRNQQIGAAVRLGKATLSYRGCRADYWLALISEVFRRALRARGLQALTCRLFRLKQNV